MRAIHTPDRVTPARARALTILHPSHALDVQLFAHYMWPASPSWGAKSPGRGVYLKARSFLTRLEAEGLVASHRASSGESYRITPEGERLATRQPIDLASREFAEREDDDWMAPLRALAPPAGLDDPL